MRAIGHRGGSPWDVKVLWYYNSLDKVFERRKNPQVLIFSHIINVPVVIHATLADKLWK